MGMNRSFTIESTILPNAAPITIPTARSTTLPRRMNFLNSSKNPFMASPRSQLENRTGCVRNAFRTQLAGGPRSETSEPRRSRDRPAGLAFLRNARPALLLGVDGRQREVRVGGVLLLQPRFEPGEHVRLLRRQVRRLVRVLRQVVQPVLHHPLGEFRAARFPVALDPRLLPAVARELPVQELVPRRESLLEEGVGEADPVDPLGRLSLRNRAERRQDVWEVEPGVAL